MAIEPVLFPDLEGPEFVRSSEVRKVAEDVLDRHGRAGAAEITTLRALRLALVDDLISVEYLLNTKPFDPMKDDVTHDAIAKVVKAPRLWHDVTGIDVVVWVRAYFWNQFDDRQRSGVLLHELLHVEVERDQDDVKLSLRHHDVEEFIQAVRFYGAFIPNREVLVKAFGLWQQDDGKPAGPTPVSSHLGDAMVGLSKVAETVGSVTISTGDRSVTIDAAAAARIRDAAGRDRKGRR